MPSRPNLYMPPTIRITLDSMQHGIVTTLNEEMIKYDEQVKAGIKKAVDEFNVEKEVCKIAKIELRSAIQHTISDEVAKAIRSGNLAGMIGRVLTSAIDRMEGVD